MSGEVTGRSPVEYLFFGVIDFICLLMAAESLNALQYVRAGEWGIAGVASVFIGYFWRSVKFNIGNLLIVGGQHLAGARSEFTKHNTRHDRSERLKSQSKLVIHSALYGVGDSSDIQIADKLNAEPREGLVLGVNNNLVNRDPAPNQLKYLVVKYSYDAGQVQTVTVPEFGWLFLPQDAQIPKLQSQLEASERNLKQAQLELENSKSTTGTTITFVFVVIISVRVDDNKVSRGKTIKIRYVVNSSEDVAGDIWLGASLWDVNKKHFSNVHQDKLVSLLKGTHEYDRDLTIPADALPGKRSLGVNVWHGVVGDSTKSVVIAKGERIPIEIVA